jgi:hypothetical protein
MSDDDSGLHEKARNLIMAGILPARPPDRMWGGAGAGTLCIVCGAPVRRDQTGLEIEYTLDGAGIRNHHVHVRCYSALEPAFYTCGQTNPQAAEPLAGEQQTGGRP